MKETKRTRQLRKLQKRRQKREDYRLNQLHDLLKNQTDLRYTRFGHESAEVRQARADNLAKKELREMRVVQFYYKDLIKLHLLAIHSFFFTFACIYYQRSNLFVFAYYFIVQEFGNVTLISTGVWSEFWVMVQMVFYVSLFFALIATLHIASLWSLTGLYKREFLRYNIFLLWFMLFVITIVLVVIFFGGQLVVFAYSFADVDTITDFALRTEECFQFLFFVFLFLTVFACTSLLLFWLSFRKLFSDRQLRFVTGGCLFFFVTFICPPDIWLHAMICLSFSMLCEFMIYFRSHFALNSTYEVERKIIIPEPEELHPDFAKIKDFRPRAERRKHHSLKKSLKINRRLCPLSKRKHN